MVKSVAYHNGRAFRADRKTKEEKLNRRRTAEEPQFELTGAQLLIFIAVLLAAAWFAGLLPDP